MASLHLDDAPPPPYTETDIYSNAGSHRSPQTPSHRSNSHGTDDASSATSNRDIIYTPPLTPQSTHQQNFVSEADHLTTASAEAYFDSRPAPRLPASVQNNLIVHSIAVKADSKSEDFPYIRDWSQRDVRVEDWQTFVNYLIPHHSAEANESVVDRKLRAEGVNDNMLSPENGHGGDRSPVVAQLEQIRTPTETAQRRQNAEDTVHEWNDGFFGPRGINIHIELFSDDLRMPGAWDQSFDHGVPETTGQPQQSGSRWRNFNPLGGSGFESNSRGGFKFAGITIDGDKLSIGNNVVADRNGLRIGDIVFDNTGVRNGSSTMFPGANAANQRGFRGPGFPNIPGLFGPGARTLTTPGMPPGDCGIDEPHRHSPTGRCMGTRGPDRRGCGHERGRSARRGRGGGRRVRSRSSSSSSSSSSCSSASDASSIGSLPDWDDLKDQQLPTTKHCLEDLLSHPDVMFTKESVRQVKDQIKAAKRENKGGFNEPANMTFDKKVLRQEVRGLMQQWKSLKKQQGQLRRQLKREKAQKRRAEKKEKRQIKREMRKAKKDARHDRRHSHGPGRGRGYGHGHGHGHGPFEGMPGVPGHGPHMHPWFGPGPGHVEAGFGRGFEPGFGVPGNTATRETGDNGAPRNPWQRLHDRFVNHRASWERDWVAGGPRPEPGSSQERFPGTWPDDAEETVAAHDPHIASQAKYQAAESMQKELVQKKAKLAKQKEQLGEGEKSGAIRVAAEGKLQGFEHEILALEQTVQRLNLEADEAYARELEIEDHRQQTM